MNLIEQTRKLIELENQAAPIPWYAKRDEGQIAHQVIDGKGYWLFDAVEDENLMLILFMRNAAPKMLAVLGSFQLGDSDTLTDIADNLERDNWKLWEDEVVLLRRLAESARIMEVDDNAK
jgi:hypothetical protein